MLYILCVINQFHSDTLHKQSSFHPYKTHTNMHLILPTLLTLLFCFLFAISPYLKGFETRFQKNSLSLILICGIIVGFISIGIVTAAANPGNHFLVPCLVISFAGLLAAGYSHSKANSKKSKASNSQ